jgi:hypothetical protein
VLRADRRDPASSYGGGLTLDECGERYQGPQVYAGGSPRGASLMGVGCFVARFQDAHSRCGPRIGDPVIRMIAAGADAGRSKL